MKWHRATIARQNVPRIGHSANFDLQSFERRIDVADGASSSRFLSQNVPRFDGLSQFDLDTAMNDVSKNWKTKIKVRCKPLLLERETYRV